MLKETIKKSLFTRYRWGLIPALLWRHATYSIMMFFCILNEQVPAASQSDRIIHLVPVIPFIARHNYHIWLICYLPLALWLLIKNSSRFIDFLYAGGVVSLLRGLAIYSTTLGPVNGRDINANRPMTELIAGWLKIINPLSPFTSDTWQVYLTKDLFFSGHTSSTFLILLYTWKYKQVRPYAIAGHIIVVATVFLSHLHYTIDVIGGWAVSFAVFTFFERYFNSTKECN
ncbi:MAG: phosphatase PAP2 family protein [Deltaproteobacteria bacterium]|nr:phosphatase PAP2 family protein [Deltaproteobacteria bacterium]